MTGRLVLGIDGGGTRTRVVLVDERGQVLGFGVAGPGNYHDIGADGVRDNIAAALDEAWRAATPAGHTRRAVDAVYLGLAGVVSTNDHTVIREVARQLSLSLDERIETGHDLRAALAGATVGLPGMVLVVGTGSACFGRDRAGQTWKAGGWGSRLDDGGGSTWLGLQAMVAAVRAADGRAEPTVLGQRVLQSLGLTALRDLVKFTDTTNINRRNIAALAHEVTQAAAEGDAPARMILERGAIELALCAKATADHLNWENTPPRIAMTGGLAEGCAMYRQLIAEAVVERVGACEIVKPRLSPTLGAAVIALERLGIRITEDVIANLAAAQCAQPDERE